MTDVAGNWQRVCERVARAAARAGRDAADVRIVAVTKTQAWEVIAQVIAAGATELGENYVQDAAEKIPRLESGVRWHLIGHLQRNKAARAVELFDVIHTVDSVALGEALARQGAQRNRAVRVLIEVNVGGESTKKGVTAEQAEGLLVALAAQQWLAIEGLMTIPPPGATPDATRPHFRTLRGLRDQLQRVAPANAPLRDLSMGMSDDFEVAVEEGATIIRVGRSIFGERQ